MLQQIVDLLESGCCATVEEDRTMSNVSIFVCVSVGELDADIGVHAKWLLERCEVYTYLFYIFVSDFFCSWGNVTDCSNDVIN